MYKIEDQKYGYRMTFDGFMKRDEVASWVKDVKKRVGGRGPFGILVDMRGASAFPADAQDVLFEGINYCRDSGMERAAIVVANPITKIQAVRVVKETGIYSIVRYLDSSTDANWEKVSLDWISKGLDPE